MKEFGQLCKLLVNRLYTHNPFYLISVFLVLYGLHRSFVGEANAERGLLLLQLFCGYILLLAVVGIVVVRWGKVWEDGRMILLIILLLFVALSMSFDGVALDAPEFGGAYLAFGFGFAMFVTESILSLLRLHLPARYRIPYYLQLAILFAYPYQLARWSVAANDPRMPWGVLLFPAICGLSLLTLWPAARRAGRGEDENGTPWNWPLYPWTLFFFLTLGMTLRAYSITMVFERAQGGENGFLPYFLNPLLLAVCLLTFEMAHARGHRWMVGLALTTAFVALGLAFGGPFPSMLQWKYLALQSRFVGMPPIWTTMLLIGLYSFAWARGVRAAEAGLLACLLLSAHLRPNSYTVWMLHEPWLAPHALIVAYQLAMALHRRATWRLLFAGALGWIDAVYFLRDTWLLEHRGYLPLHAVLLFVLLAGLVFDDRLARWLRRVAPWAIGISALLVALGYPQLFPTAPAQWHLQWLTLLIATAAAYWLKTKRLHPLAAGLVSAVAYVTFAGRAFYTWLRNEQLLKGLDWLAWGFAFLGAAALISLAKAGFLATLLARLRRWESTWRRPDTSEDRHR
ncbi:MAG: hypothetical protein KDA42_08825 [Planctomycetales bacterium]|nr:hypothetical protein [Planctomycetales bacterium]